MVGCVLGVINESHDVGLWNAADVGRMFTTNNVPITVSGQGVATWYPSKGNLRLRNSASVSNCTWRNDDVGTGGLHYVRMNAGGVLTVDSSVRAIGVNVTMWLIVKWPVESTAGPLTWSWLKSTATTTSIMGGKYGPRVYINSQLNMSWPALPQGVNMLLGFCIKQIGNDTVVWWMNNVKAFSQTIVTNTNYMDKDLNQLQIWLSTNLGSFIYIYGFEIDDTNYATSADWIARADVIRSAYQVP